MLNKHLVDHEHPNISSLCANLWNRPLLPSARPLQFFCWVFSVTKTEKPKFGQVFQKLELRISETSTSFRKTSATLPTRTEWDWKEKGFGLYARKACAQGFRWFFGCLVVAAEHGNLEVFIKFNLWNNNMKPAEFGSNGFSLVAKRVVFDA